MLHLYRFKPYEENKPKQGRKQKKEEETKRMLKFYNVILVLIP